MASDRDRVSAEYERALAEYVRALARLRAAERRRRSWTVRLLRRLSGEKRLEAVAGELVTATANLRAAGGQR